MCNLPTPTPHITRHVVNIVVAATTVVQAVRGSKHAREQQQLQQQEHEEQPRQWQRQHQQQGDFTYSQPELLAWVFLWWRFPLAMREIAKVRSRGAGATLVWECRGWMGASQ